MQYVRGWQCQCNGLSCNHTGYLKRRRVVCSGVFFEITGSELSAMTAMGYAKCAALVMSKL